jgi:hypothetical protein
MKWHFTEWPPQFVETEVTQEDQFRNEEVDLSDTLVRESIQNSLDARTVNNGQAIVRLSFVGGDMSPINAEFMQNLFEGHLGHAKAAGFELSGIDFNCPHALIIEDYGTTGLTGNWQFTDDGNFSDFG